MTSQRSSHTRPRNSTSKRNARGVKKNEQAPSGFVPLTTLTQVSVDPAKAFDEIRSLYFNTTKRTIETDLAHAIELLRSLPSEAIRERATVYMDGLAQMRRDWARKAQT